MSTTAKKLEVNEISVTKLYMPVSFGVLYQSEIWICDTGVFSHSTNNRSGSKKEKDSGNRSLGYAGAAVEATSTINLLEQFMARNGSLGMKVY